MAHRLTPAKHRNQVWFDQGHRMRRLRDDAGLTRTQACKHLAIPRHELLYAEAGQIDPSEYLGALTLHPYQIIL